MILPYQNIKRRCLRDGLLSPWSERTVVDGMTYGLSSAGYDIRAAEELVLTPGTFQLASSVERFNMPHDLLAQVCDKSSWARRGLLVQNTIIEPGWRGYLTLELTYHGTEKCEIEYGTPIAQILFMRLEEPTEHPYVGKYQDQPEGAQESIHEA